MYMSYLKEKFSALNSEFNINEDDGYMLEKL
jgi:hypothetical protein